MSAQPADSPRPVITPDPKRASLLPQSWRWGTVVAVIMIVLALIGVALTSSNSHHAVNYWIWLAPVYGILCIGTAWRRGSEGLKNDMSTVMQQILHWLGIGVAMFLEFTIRSTGEETATASAFNAVLILALGCYLAGIHLEGSFIIVGLLLTMIMIVIAKAEQYQWIIFVAGGLVLAGMIGWSRIRRRCGLRTRPLPSKAARGQASVGGTPDRYG
ncbi:MAG: hypothetical protein QM703_29485 [Gemmatales bacterium]